MNPLRPVAVKLGSQPWLPRFAPAIVGLDKGLQRVTRGRLTLLDLAGLPELMLTVRGRKSGIERSVPLLCTPHDGGWLVAGSNWGGPKPPMWVANLLAADTAEVTYGGRRTTVRAVLLEGADRARAWQVLLSTWPNYDKYAERTDREIKVFHLRPI
jgi:deazaflavin-dependent oxidoreductase (nitroreductase family)